MGLDGVHVESYKPPPPPPENVQQPASSQANVAGHQVTAGLQVTAGTSLTNTQQQEPNLQQFTLQLKQVAMSLDPATGQFHPDSPSQVLTRASKSKDARVSNENTPYIKGVTQQTLAPPNVAQQVIQGAHYTPITQVGTTPSSPAQTDFQAELCRVQRKPQKPLRDDSRKLGKPSSRSVSSNSSRSSSRIAFSSSRRPAF